MVRRFFSGIGYLLRGLRVWGTNPGVMLLGAIPALIVGAVYVTAIVLLALNLDALVTWLTPFADALPEPVRPLVRVAAGFVLVAVTAFLFANTYAALTLAVGDPFYERVWRRTEQLLGNPPPEPKLNIGRAIGNALRLVLVAIGIAILLFAGGFIPIVGTFVIPVLGAFWGGWLLALELSGYASDARELTLKQRRWMLGRSRARTLGFGVATYLLFLVPLAAIFVMPAAVAGATMLLRDSLPATPPPRTPA